MMNTQTISKHIAELSGSEKCVWLRKYKTRSYVYIALNSLFCFIFSSVYMYFVYEPYIIDAPLSWWSNLALKAIAAPVIVSLVFMWHAESRANLGDRDNEILISCNICRVQLLIFIQHISLQILTYHMAAYPWLSTANLLSAVVWISGGVYLAVSVWIIRKIIWCYIGCVKVVAQPRLAWDMLLRIASMGVIFSFYVHFIFEVEKSFRSLAR